MSFDVVVIGAGPSGSAAALRLARAGASVALVEKAPFPRRKVCGEFLSASSIGLLDEIGLADRWCAAAGPEVRRVGLYAGEHVAAARMPSGEGGGFGRALGRDRLDQLLRDSAVAAGAVVIQPWQAVGLERTGETRLVSLVQGRRRRHLVTRAVIAAHGSWEPGRLDSQLDQPRRAADLFGFKAHFRGAALPSDLMPLVLFPGGYGGLVWSDGGRVSFSCCIRRDVLAAVRADYGGRPAGEAVFRHVSEHCRGVREALGAAVPERGWLAAGPIRPGIRAGYADDLFRVGNLAGESHPLIAEGIAMALQSGWLLGQTLAEVGDFGAAGRAEAGRRYQALWGRQFALRVRASAVFAALAALPGGVALAGPLIALCPKILTAGALISGKTKPLPAVSAS